VIRRDDAEHGAGPAAENLAADPRSPRERRLVLAGASNFRDLGGYETADGRRVRWGRIYRSDALAALTEEDVERIAALGLRTVFDLRHESERLRHPDRGVGPSTIRCEMGFLPYRADTLLGAIAARTISAAEIVAGVREAYRRFPLDHAPAFASLLDALGGAESLPALIHCTSGRDRTGFAAAVLLRALGVPRETIAEDYALSEKYRRDPSFLFDEPIDREILAALGEARAEYLETAFVAIDERWGSDEAFLEEALGVGEEQRTRLRELFLEPRDGELA
jgi:protein-tyrosine phosphatase